MAMSKLQPGCCCGEITDCGFDGSDPATLDVTFTGWANTGCTNCANLNTTLELAADDPPGICDDLGVLGCCWSISLADLFCIGGTYSMICYTTPDTLNPGNYLVSVTIAASATNIRWQDSIAGPLSGSHVLPYLSETYWLWCDRTAVTCTVDLG